MSDEPCELLPWDTEFFGVTIGRLHGDTLTPDSWRNVEQWSLKNDIRCLYCTLASDFTSSRVMEREGGKLVDVKTYYAWTPPARWIAPAVRTKIRQARESDVPALAQIAGLAHRDRFHNDGNFPPEKCDEMYRVWIRKSVTIWNEHVLLAEDATGRACGYCTCVLGVDAGGTTGVIGLIAVDEAARGKGVGSDLVNAALTYFVAAGVARVELNTQAYNVPAQRVYQRCGFVIYRCYLVYHKWFDRDEHA